MWRRLTEKRTLSQRLTQKRILHPTAHAKAHSGIITLTQKRTLIAYLTKRRILHASDGAECAFP